MHYTKKKCASSRSLTSYTEMYGQQNIKFRNIREVTVKLIYEEIK